MEKNIYNGLTKLAFLIKPNAKQGNRYTIKPVYGIKAGLRDQKAIEINMSIVVKGETPFDLEVVGTYGYERGERELSEVTLDCVKQTFESMKKKIEIIMLTAGVKPYELPEPDFSKSFIPKNNLS